MSTRKRRRDTPEERLHVAAMMLARLIKEWDPAGYSDPRSLAARALRGARSAREKAVARDLWALIAAAVAFDKATRRAAQRKIDAIMGRGSALRAPSRGRR